MLGHLRLGASLLLSLVIATSALAQAPPADTRRDLNAAIPEMIRLLEAKSYAPFIRSYMPPEQQRDLASAGKLEDVVKKLNPEIFAIMLRQLKGTRGITPTQNADGSQMKFTFAKPIDGSSQVTFIKLGEFWYIK